MRLHIHNPFPSRIFPSSPTRTFPEEPSGGPPILLITIVLIVACIGFAIKPFIEVDKEGKLILSKWRKEKLERELKGLDEAEQYVLVAKRKGMYPCYSCPHNITIALHPFEVWKYGFTTKSENGRYQKTLESKNLLYFVQYQGTITECMKEEKRKIYHYALLPENIKRLIPLIRPPGNKQDN